MKGLKAMNDKLLMCPMKFMALAKTTKVVGASSASEMYKIVSGCEGKYCAWYCTYPNGEGECAIRSLPGLLDSLDSIATQIAMK